MSGILNWAIEGCLKWQQDGLKEPEAVKVATGDYKEDMDVLSSFLKECCSIDDPTEQVEAKIIYETYLNWCNYGDIILKRNTFYRALETKGFRKFRGNRNKQYFTGVSLKSENDQKSNTFDAKSNTFSPKSNTFSIENKKSNTFVTH